MGERIDILFISTVRCSILYVLCFKHLFKKSIENVGNVEIVKNVKNHENYKEYVENLRRITKKFQKNVEKMLKKCRNSRKC